MTASASRLQDSVSLCLFAPKSAVSTFARPILISALGARMFLPASLSFPLLLPPVFPSLFGCLCPRHELVTGCSDRSRPHTPSPGAQLLQSSS